MYVAKTNEIRVSVEPTYLDEQSAPSEGHYVWAYHVRIANEGSDTVQLLTRYWSITDAMGRVQEVRGAGVVGEQPILAPGESYEYTSGTPLPTASGIMRGTYGMRTTHGQRFEIEIPAFSLDSPYDARRVN